VVVTDLNGSSGRLLYLIAESEAPSEQESKAKDGNFFSAERNQLKVETE
jgi:hypothetical protein